MANYTGYIYSITNKLNGKSYIGKTNDLERRWKEHRYHHGGTAILNKAFNKYGVENFVFDTVAQIPFDTVEELNSTLNQLEVYYISLYNTFNDGYNATVGGEGISYYHHSDNTKKKISDSQKGRTLTEERKAKCGLAFKGHHHTEEAKKAIRKALLARDVSIYEKVAKKLEGKKRDHNMIMKAAAKRRKPILQYSIDGKFIKEFCGASLIPDYDNANIIACCKYKINNAYGYIWRYKETDNIPMQIKVSSDVHIKNRSVLQYSKDGKLLCEYSCVNDAAKEIGVNRSALANCLAGLSKTCRGFIWNYKERKEVIYA